MSNRRHAAFTLAEMMISLTLAGVLGGIIYMVAGEAMASFARNISINRSYTDAHTTIDRIAQTLSTAGHAPILVDTNGSPVPLPTPTPTPTPGTTPGPTPTPSPAAGIRFYRADPNSTYQITAGSTGPGNSNNTITIRLAAGQTAPRVKDIVTIPTMGYQGTVSSVSTVSSVCTLTMVNAIAADCSPAPVAAVNFPNPTIPPSPPPSPSPAVSPPPYYLQSYTQVAYITVGNQLRYYPQAKVRTVPTADPVFDNPANFQVVANLASTAFDGTGAAATNTLLPFTLAASPTVTVQLYTLNPDYTNRNTANSNSIGTADTYTFMQSSLGPRSPVTTVRGPY